MSSDVFVLNDDQQSAVRVFLVQEGDRTLLHVTLLQQVFLQHKSKEQQPSLGGDVADVPICFDLRLLCLHAPKFPVIIDLSHSLTKN